MGPRGRVDGLLLAGGRSRRFGSDKRFARVGGTTLARLAAQKLRRSINGTLFIAAGRRVPDLGIGHNAVFVNDAVVDSGPLGGIVGGLLRSDAGILVLACDLPHIKVEMLKYTGRLGVRIDRPVAARGHRGWEPLAAWYPRWMLPLLRSALAQGLRSPQIVLDRAGCVPLHWPEEKQFLNINRPGDMVGTRRNSDGAKKER